MVFHQDFSVEFFFSLEHHDQIYFALAGYAQYWIHVDFNVVAHFLENTIPSSVDIASTDLSSHL